MNKIAIFNIIAEAKMRTFVEMTKKYHPKWTTDEIEDFLKRLVEFSIKKELKEA